MDLHLFRTTWGVDRPWSAFLPALAADGFHGIEAPLPHLQQHRKDVAAHPDLRCIPMVFTEGETVQAHVASFREQLDACLALDPIRITCHDGVDAWSDEAAVQYYAEVLAIEADVDVPVAHETHRGRILCTPWRTARLLDRFDALRLCCDYSHWVCVCERLLDDLGDILAGCAERAQHVHARVGYEEGPQVPDPRAPAYARHLAAHERWWDAIWTAQQRQGLDVSTLTAEFGPPPYLHTLPYTEMPVADLDAVCRWMSTRQAERFASTVGT